VTQYDAAISKYNEAIKLNRDPIYFCNRAAVYCRLEQYDLAIQDCRTALALDPRYAKAYGRMGVALSCQNRYDHAVEAYKQALEIDPNNESYKQNLSIAENKLAEAQVAMGGNAQNPMGAGFPGMGGLGGLGGLLNNPQMMQMATQMMSDPNVQNMMSQMMTNFMGGAAGGGAPGQPPIENFLRAGENLAQQMEQANPELVEQLRRQFGMGGMGDEQGHNPQGDGAEGGGNNPDGTPKPPPPGSV